MPASDDAKHVMRTLHLERPLAMLDIESTGTNPRADRIIDLAVIKLLPGGTREVRIWALDPETPIPRESTAIHGISDADVVGRPSFQDEAEAIAAFLADCDLGGYNAIRFDIPLLAAEFQRAGVAFSIDDRRLVDAQRIFHRKEPRDLTAALQFYCGEAHPGSHNALEDVEATVRVLEGQLQRYGDLPATIAELHEFCNQRNPDWVDREGRLRWVHGEVAINFGRYAGRSLKSLLPNQSGFLHWILQNEFPDDTKLIIRHAMEGIYPDPPEAPPEG